MDTAATNNLTFGNNTVTDGVESLLSSTGNAVHFDDTATAFGNNVTHYDYYFGEYYYDDVYSYYFFEIYIFEIYTLGLVQPILIVVAALTNIFVAFYFLKKKDRLKATNLLFVSIAFSDTMTGLMLLPNGFGVYARDYTELSREWCNAYMTLRFYMSPVFHTVSVWQTVLLCIQRYLCVCHPFISGRICTFWKTFVSIVIMYCAAIVLHVYHLIDNKIGHFRCRWKTEMPCKESCIYLWFAIVLQHLLPCLILLILTIITIKELAKAQRRLSGLADKRNSMRHSRDKIITYTAVLIVVFFLIPELPHGVYKLVFVIFKHVDNYDAISAFNNHVFISVYELALTVSFCANFWIYCCMMRDFRRKLKELLSCGIFKRGFQRLRSLSASSRGGSHRSNTSNTGRNRMLSRTTSLHSTVSDNIHAVIPLTPTRCNDVMNFQQETTSKPNVDILEDDVFC